MAVAKLNARTTGALEEFGLRAADSAMRGAIARLVPAGTRPTWSEAEVEELLVLIREETKAALPAALEDARKAFESGMGGFASATFAASMTLAGVAAAKRFEARKGAAK